MFGVPARRLVIVFVMLAIALPGTAVLEPGRARAAGGSCTGWHSTVVPPDTIRVGRADGRVETVQFRRYVGVVMAKEWPAWMPTAALEAGATAVKQYGWFYALAGKHRSSYVNAGGQCFDVRDSTVDQLYRPEGLTVGTKIWQAVDATLGLSVRKSGKFFLTGYRAGKSSVCASDVDGTRLFAKSVIACAENGWSRERIQRAYYAPDVTFHWADAAPALAGISIAITPPRVTLRQGATLAGAHARVQWDEAAARPEGATYQLQRLVSGSWTDVPLAAPAKPSVALRLKPGQTHRFRVRLRTAAGQVGDWFTGPSFDARLVQDRAAAFVWGGGWQRTSTAKASGGTVTHASVAGSQVSANFTGRAVGLVATVGPNRGRARIYVDGRLDAEVDLQAPTTKWRVLVFTREWPASGAHTLRVEVVGTAGRPRVDVDALLVHR